MLAHLPHLLLILAYLLAGVFVFCWVGYWFCLTRARRLLIIKSQNPNTKELDPWNARSTFAEKAFFSPVKQVRFVRHLDPRLGAILRAVYFVWIACAAALFLLVIALSELGAL